MSKKWTVYKVYFGVDCYIGATGQVFTNRVAQHKYDTLNPNSKKYHIEPFKTFRKIGWEWLQWEILETHTQRREASRAERRYIKLLRPSLNDHEGGFLPSLTEEQREAAGRARAGVKLSKESLMKMIESRHMIPKRYLQKDNIVINAHKEALEKGKSAREETFIPPDDEEF